MNLFPLSRCASATKIVRPFAIHGCDAAPTPIGFAEIVSDDFPAVSSGLRRVMSRSKQHSRGSDLSTDWQSAGRRSKSNCRIPSKSLVSPNQKLFAWTLLGHSLDFDAGSIARDGVPAGEQGLRHAVDSGLSRAPEHPAHAASHERLRFDSKGCCGDVRPDYSATITSPSPISTSISRSASYRSTPRLISWVRASSSIYQCHRKIT
jgi:hypothetical protein